MKNLVFATAALSLAAIGPASAQMMGDPMMPMGPQSCVMNGQFVPCPPMGGMPSSMTQPGMMNQGAGMRGGVMMEEPGMDQPMSARERRQQQRVMRQQSM